MNSWLQQTLSARKNINYLAPRDFFLFPKLTEGLKGVTFHSLDALKYAVQDCLDHLAKDGFTNVFQSWVKRREKCVLLGEKYVEK